MHAQEATMIPDERFPDYIHRLPGITLHDPLAELLGAPADGRFHYRFADAVRLAGHACPTVAGAWLCTTRALAALHPDSVPQRGQLRVELGDPEDHGVAGVIAAVAGLLTGAAGQGGFKGLGGQHCRQGLLRFGVAGVQHLRFTRLDQARSVDCHLNLGAVPADPETGPLLGALLGGHATAGQRARFAALWQHRVERILCHADAHPGLLSLR
jgi:hypothetical protein